MTTFTFRTDASTQIGTGHVMRCLALADSLRENGVDCRFVCRQHTGHLLEAIHKRGYEAAPLPAPAEMRPEVISKHLVPGDWLGATWEEDAQQTIEAVAPIRPDWLVVDHYWLDARWEGALRPYCGAVMCIDDLADRPHDADLLLDQNFGRLASDYQSLVPEKCRVLTGAKYSLLRREFSSLRSTSLQRRRHCAMRHLLVALGGVDKDNVTCAILEALAISDLPADCEVVVVVGSKAPWVQQVRDAAARLPWLATVYCGPDNVAQLMAESDLAIGAAGTMAWERCCLGLPTLIAVLADNQRAGARALARSGASITLDMARLSTSLPDAIRDVQQPEVLARMQEAAASVTDGAGTSRVMAEIWRQSAEI